HATMVVGPTSGGKSVVIKALSMAQTSLQLKTVTKVINPKAQTVNELYGVLDPVTHDWTDGLLSNMFRTMNNTPIGEGERIQKNLLFDGDVDTLWIENLNSVLDDSKLLTLPNSERISLRDHCKMLFEVGDLQYASPATISRCGMVYVDPKDLGYSSVFKSFLKRREHPPQVEILDRLFKKYVPPLVEYVFEGDKAAQEDMLSAKKSDEDTDSLASAENVPGLNGLRLSMPITPLNTVVQLCTMLDSLMKNMDAEVKITRQKGEDDPVAVRQGAPDDKAVSLGLEDRSILEGLFVFCVVWSIGACIIDDDRKYFDEKLKRVSGLNIIETKDSDVGSGCLPGTEETIYNHFYDMRLRRWIPWEHKVSPFEANPTGDPGKLFSSLVSTVDTTRHTFLLDQLMNTHDPVLFVGESGTAKTVTINNYLASLSREEWVTLTIAFSSRTSALDVQRTLEDSLEKRMKNTYGPPSGHSMAFFIDDLSMPTIDEYGTQQPVALLHYLVSYHGIYDREGEKNLKEIVQVFPLCATQPGGGGRNVVDPRFVSHFSTFNISFPSKKSLEVIFSSILKCAFSTFTSDDIFTNELPSMITDATLAVYDHVNVSLPPTPAKFHYVFNLRDLSRVVHGVCQATPDSFETVGEIGRLWRNECTRVFCDRLVNDTDRKVVAKKIGEQRRAEYEAEKLGVSSVIPVSLPASRGGESQGSILSVEEDPNSHALYADFGNLEEIFIREEDDAMAEEEGENEQDGFGDEFSDAAEEQNDADEMPEVSALRLYEDLGSFDNVGYIAEVALRHYNKKYRPMSLVFFPQAIDHLVRIHRILRMPGGNAMLIGVGGTGKSSLTRLAAFMAGCELFEITLSRGYGEEEFKEDLKRLYTMLGAENKNVVFLFTESHVANESFLELINTMLASGMIPALFSEDEKDRLNAQVKESALREGIVETKDMLWKFFVERCKSNLHVALCFSPIGDTLRLRCRAFPALISACTINWFTGWDNSALKAVADALLCDLEFPKGVLDGGHKKKKKTTGGEEGGELEEAGGSEELSKSELRRRENLLRSAIVDNVVFTHQEVMRCASEFEIRQKKNSVTPKNFLDFINSYKLLLVQLDKDANENITRLSNGLEKLLEATRDVEKKQVEVKAKSIEVANKKHECEEMVREIDKNSREVEKATSIATKTSRKLESLKGDLKIKMDEARLKLAEAAPLLEAAEEALDQLEIDALRNIKTVRSPVPVVEKVIQCVYILHSKKGSSLPTKKGPRGRDVPNLLWPNMMGFMQACPFFKDKSFNVDILHSDAVKFVKVHYLEKKDFTPSDVKTASSFAFTIYKWVKNIVNFYEAKSTVDPLEQQARQCERDVKQNEKSKEETDKLLKELKAKSADLNRRYTKAMQERNRLEQEAEKMSKQLESARKLITGLSGERVRWANDVKQLKRNRINLVGDTLLLAAFLCYCGPFTHEYRRDLIYGTLLEDIKTRCIPLRSDFKLESLLTNEVEIMKWASEKLPGDELSIQNGILTTRASRFPLCIDPQMQASTWIKAKEGEDLKIHRFSDADYL
ncbi:Dynein-1-alpha heavy chain, flagellar inner arm I1 complex, partial [Aduncisulcus paluster]